MGARRHQQVFLTGKAMRSEPGWDAALHLPFPPAPDFYLLEEARRQVIAYLDWITHDLGRGPPPEELRRNINDAAARLLEISFAIRGLLDSDNSDSVQTADE